MHSFIGSNFEVILLRLSQLRWGLIPEHVVQKKFY